MKPAVIRDSKTAGAGQAAVRIAEGANRILGELFAHKAAVILQMR